MAESLVKNGLALNQDDWDDSALIEAYDKAMGIVQRKLSNKKTTEKVKVPKKPSNRKANKQKWKLGEFCRAVYSVDQRLYEAVIVDVDEENGMCVVQYVGYGNEEHVDLSSICPSQGKKARFEQIRMAQAGSDQCEWRVGDKCMAMYSEDGLYYQAEIVFVSYEEAFCTVRYLEYGEEEDVDLIHVVPLESNELSFPSEVNGAASGSSFDETSSNMSSVSSVGGNARLEGHFQRSPQRHYPAPLEMPNFFLPDGLVPNVSDYNAMGDLGPMLMSWYMAGFHTGYYQGRSSRFVSGSPHPPNS